MSPLVGGRIIQWSLIGLLMALTGCAHPNDYQEPDLSSEAVGTLRLAKGEGHPEGFLGPTHAVVVQEIDGQDSGQSRDWDQLKTLLPGEHQIVAEYRRVQYLGSHDRYNLSFSISVEAGLQYQIRGRMDERVIRIWVEETESKEVVGMATLVLEESGRGQIFPYS